MTHCTSTMVAFRFACSAGNATFTTVLSINAMLEARVVATRTQRPARFEQGAAVGAERITLSSQGSRMNASITMARLVPTEIQPCETANRARNLLSNLSQVLVVCLKKRRLRQGPRCPTCHHPARGGVRKFGRREKK